jgi:hypothetical protein
MGLITRTAINNSQDSFNIALRQLGVKGNLHEFADKGFLITLVGIAKPLC